MIRHRTLTYIAHQQQYWLKRQENDRNRVIWSRKQYVDHVLEYLTDAENVGKVFTAWRSQQEMPKNPRQVASNPNEREFNEPDEEDKRRQQLREEVIKRFKTQMQEEIERPQGADKRPAHSKRISANPRADTDSDSSASASVVSVTSRADTPKARPKRTTMQLVAWRRRSDKSDKTESAASEKPSASTDEKKSSNKQPTVRRPPRQQTSERAKEMLSDADAARRVYERMQRKLVQDFANIQWFALDQTALYSAETPNLAAPITQCFGATRAGTDTA